MPDQFPYVTSGPWGSGTGQPHSANQADQIVFGLATRVKSLEDDPPQANGIADVIPNGRQLTIVMDDATEHTVTLPVAVIKFKGQWQASTQYFELDIVEVPGTGLFLVLQDHESASSFDPDREIDSEPVYHKVFGTGLEGIEEIADATHAPSFLDNGKYFTCTNAGGCVVTLPSNSTAALPIGFVAHYEASASLVRIEGAMGVTVNHPASRDSETAEQFAVLSVVKVAPNLWTLIGYLAEADASSPS